MDKNVKIPLPLFNQVIDFMECFDGYEFDPALSCYHQTILTALLKKRQSLDLRHAYSEIIYAENEDKRFNARMRYLQKKNYIADEL